MSKPATVEEVARAIACAEWMKSFENASERAGGGSWSAVKDLTVEEAMKLLAPNGFRFAHDNGATIQARAAELVRAIEFLPKPTP